MSLVKSTKNNIVSSKSVSGAAGKAMVVAAAGGMGLLLAAALIPFLSVFWLCVGLIVLGVLIAE